MAMKAVTVAKRLQQNVTRQKSEAGGTASSGGGGTCRRKCNFDGSCGSAGGPLKSSEGCAASRLKRTCLTTGQAEEARRDERGSDVPGAELSGGPPAETLCSRLLTLNDGEVTGESVRINQPRQRDG